MLRQIRDGLILLLVLAAAAGAQQKPAPKHHAQTAKAATTAAKPVADALPTEDTVNSFLQQMFAYEPEISWKVMAIRPSPAEGLAEVDVLVSNPHGEQGSILYVTADGHHAVIGNIIPFGARPFDPAWQTLKKGINGPSRGPANAPVTVVEFADLQCPHCKAAVPVLDRLMTEEPDVRLVYQNFPLNGHDWAAKGAAYADCIGRNSTDAFWKFIHAVFDAQADITAANADDKLTALATQAGADGAQTAVCAAEPATTTRVQQSVALGKEVEVNSTPTVFINGRKIEEIGALPDDVLKKLVEFAAHDAEDQQAKMK
jgi:protein-disulfide isomerase